MRTAGCFDRNNREAEWAVSCHCDRCLSLVLQAIHLTNEHEYHESDNQEVGQGVEEEAIIDCGRTAALASARVA
jgi:hypothetical protein